MQIVVSTDFNIKLDSICFRGADDAYKIDKYINGDNIDSLQ